MVSSASDSIVRYSRHVRSFHHVPQLFQRDDGLEQVGRIIRHCGVAVVLPIDFTAMQWCARHRGAPELDGRLPPMADATTLASLHDKQGLQQCLATAGLPTAGQVTIEPGADPWAKIGGLEFPLMLKTAGGRGGVGILKADNADGLTAAARREPYSSERWIAQEFVDGHDRDLSMLCDSGNILAWCAQQGVGDRRTLNGSDRMLEIVVDPELVAQAATLVKATGFSGVAHLDYRRCARTGKLVLLDFNPRFWASLIASLAAGVNFPDLMCRCALGEVFPAPAPRTGIFLTDYLPLLEILARVTGLRGKRVPLAMTAWRWHATDPLVQAARLVRAVRNRATRFRP